MSARNDLLRLRELLVPLAESFELDDPEKGVVAWVPVVGGTFAHPVTRETIGRLKVYGAGADRVKIAEPLFMRSLPIIPIVGLEHPSQLCSAVARMVGEELGELGRVRDALAAMGIDLDLEHDVLRLRGRLELQGVQVEMTTRDPDSLTICALGDRPLAMLDRQERKLELTGQAPADLDELGRLVRTLKDRLQRQSLEHMEQGLGLSGDETGKPAGQPAAPAQDAPAGPQVPAEPASSVDLGSGWGESIPDASSPAQAQPEPKRFADGTSDVVELTEMVAEEEQALEPLAEERPEEKGPEEEKEPAETFDPLRLDYLFEATGGDTEISAHEGRLRLTVPFKVVQGKYTFYLEQIGDKQFAGFLVSPTGARHKVSVDFTAVMDLKEVFERVMLGK